jgi:hypothetical protein
VQRRGRAADLGGHPGIGKRQVSIKKNREDVARGEERAIKSEEREEGKEEKRGERRERKEREREVRGDLWSGLFFGDIHF